MAYIKALMFLAKQGMLGFILFGISLAIAFVGYKIEVICLSKAKRLAIVILTISLICWLYGELRALGVIIYPDDRQYFLHGLEHENHGYTLSFIFASYTIGGVIGFCRAKRKGKYEDAYSCQRRPHSIIEINGYQADMLLFDDPETSNCILLTDENNCAHAVHAFLDEAALIELAESVKIVD